MYRVIIILTLWLSFVFSEMIGGYPGSGFKYGTNAREIALSGSMISNYNHGFNAFSNPALLSKISTNKYALSYFPMSLDRSIQVVSISRAVPPSAGISLSYFRVGTDNIKYTDDSNNFIGTGKHSESYGMISFGTHFNKISLGINLKALFHRLTDDYSSTGIGFDIGINYEISKTLSLGVLIKDINSNYLWNDIDNRLYEEDLPNIYSAGIKKVTKYVSISSQYDALHIEDYTYHDFKIGLETILDNMKIKNPFTIRLGYIKSKSSYSFGFGLPININKDLLLILDYAIDPNLFNEGISHLISITIEK